MPHHLRCASTLLLISIGVAAARSAAHAGCNIIPPAARTFAGTAGVLNRPFAAPGEAVFVGRRACDGSPIDTSDASKYIVTVAFKPKGPQRRLVVLTTDCSAIQSQVSACSQAVCSEVLVDQGLGVVGNSPRLWFRFPDTAGMLQSSPNQDPFPGFAGPAAIAVTTTNEPLPCSLATTPCSGMSPTNLVACVDDFLADSTSCSAPPTKDPLAHFVALPRPNEFGSECHENNPPCGTDARTELRLALDRDGNALVPVNWQGVTVSGQQQATLRLVRGAVKWPHAVGIPSADFLASYSPQGVRLPPLFAPLSGPSGSDDVIQLFGSTDAPYSVLRVARRAGKCNGGPKAGVPCAGDDGCPGGKCEDVCVNGNQLGGWCGAGPPCGPQGRCGKLFDLDADPVQGAGPVVMKWPGPPRGCRKGPHQACTPGTPCPGGGLCARYALFAQFPVRFPALQTTQFSAFVVREDLDADRNGDLDTSDHVMIVQDRESGDERPIGARDQELKDCGLQGEPPGRALVMGQRGAFLYPHAAAEGTVLTFLESEAGQNGCDIDGNGKKDDAVLRIYEVGAKARLKNKLMAVDLTELVNGSSLALSRGRVFFRQADGNQALRVLDTANASNSHALCPATTVAVADGIAAFLRPEEATGGGGCPGGSLNGDADTADEVVHLWSGKSLHNLGRAATAVSVSASWVAAAVSETAHTPGRRDPEVACPNPAPISDRNCDGDADDAVLAVHPVSGATGWINSMQAADALQVSGNVVVFITPERSQGLPLNGDNDDGDRVLQLYYPAQGRVLNVGQAAEEFVVGEPVDCGDGTRHQFVAFRTDEDAQGQQLNDDNDTNDGVLQVVDVLHPEPRAFGPKQAVTPCPLAACDPRLPYRVTGRTVRYLTRECDQGGMVTNGCPAGGTDLNDDGDADDLIVQVFDACLGASPTVAHKAATLGSLTVSEEVSGSQLVDPLLVQDGTQMFFTTLPGRCVPTEQPPDFGACAAGTIPDLTLGACVRAAPETCDTDDACGPAATCRQRIARVVLSVADDDHNGVPDDLQAAAFEPAKAPAQEPGCICRLFPWLRCCRDAGELK